jgi:limonene-1,2-epoxide hydrolase
MRAVKTDQSESVARAFLAAWKHPEIDELVAYFHEDAVLVDGSRGVHHGRAAIRTAFEGQLSVLPSVAVEIRKAVSDGQTVLIERTDRFEIAGKAIVLEGVVAFDVDDDGRITRFRDYYDLNAIERQLGEAP